MSGSNLTVIGGHSSTQGLTGLVTIPSGFTGALVTSLQSMLTADSNTVAAGNANFENLNVAGQSGAKSATVGSFSSGILEITNTSSVGATTSGSASISLSENAGYTTLIVQAPGDETITGNGGANALDIFGANSSVNFNTNGGTGSIFAGGADNTVLFGSNWIFNGSPNGGETVAGLANNSSISVAGAGAGAHSNVVSADATDVSITAAGTTDLVVIYSGTALVSAAGGGTVLVDGGAVTVSAAAGSSDVSAFFDTNGGELDFINNSTVAASVFGAVSGAVGGNATVFGGAGGGYYQGGPGGNNSLVGGSGSVTLIGSGDNNYLKGAGANNAFFAAGGATTMVAAAGSGSNLFSGGTGSLTVSTSGSAGQTFFVGASGQEIFTGSTVSGAVNSFYFLQDSTGGGSDIIQNFRLGTDHILINPFGNASTQGVTVSQVDSIKSSVSHPSGGSLVLLSDNTTITLYGVNANAIQSDVGGTSI
jgi:hypothetical protein